MRKILIGALVILTFSFFSVSRSMAQYDLISGLTIPFKGINHNVLFIDYYSKEMNLNQILSMVSDETSVNISTSSINENNGLYAWNVQNDKYLNNIKGLNKEIDLETFNSLNSIEENDISSEYYFNFIEDNFIRKLIPLKHYSGEIRYIDVFSENENNMEDFFKQLESEGVYFTLITNDTPDQSIITSLKNGIKGTPLSLVGFSLVIILLYLTVYQNRRNIGIYLINGRTKFHFVKYLCNNLYKVFIPTMLLSFMVFQILNVTNFTHFISIFMTYISLMFFLLIIFTLAITVFAYSLTEVSVKSYLYGYSNKSITSFVTLGFKFILTTILLVNIFTLVNRVYWSKDIMINAHIFAKTHSNIFSFSTDDSSIILNNSNQLIENLSNNGNGYLVSYNIDMNQENGKSQLDMINNKIVYANNNYIRKQNLYDEDGSPLTEFNSESLYITRENYELIKDVNPNILIDDNIEREIVFLSIESSIVPWTNNILSKSNALINDFIIINREMDQHSHLPNILINLDVDNLSEEKNKLLENTDINNLDLINLGEMFEKEDQISKDSLYWEIQWVIVYIFVILIVSLIHNQVLFDKRKKEYTVYYVNGYSKINTFFVECIYHLVVFSLIIIVVKNLLYPTSPFSYIITPFIIIFVVEVIIVLISVKKFYRDMGYILKERI